MDSGAWGLCRGCYYAMAWTRAGGAGSVVCGFRTQRPIIPPPDLVHCNQRAAIGASGRLGMDEMERLAVRIDTRPMPGQHL